MIAQGEIWWADLGEPIGSAPGYRRPVLIVQCDAINASRIGTAVCVPLTSNLKWGDAPGNVILRASITGLPKDSEPPRLSRRPHNLRGWGNGNIKAVFSGSSGACGADGGGAPA